MPGPVPFSPLANLHCPLLHVAHRAGGREYPARHPRQRGGSEQAAGGQGGQAFTSDGDDRHVPQERVAAALENGHLLTVVNQCLDSGIRAE